MSTACWPETCSEQRDPERGQQQDRAGSSRWAWASARIPDRVPYRIPDRVPDRIPDRVPYRIPDRVPDRIPDRVPYRIPDRVPDPTLEEAKAVPACLERPSVWDTPWSRTGDLPAWHP